MMINKPRKYLNFISFLKFISMIIIIKFHLFHWKIKPIHIAQRMVEFLFVSSGFLVGYNYYKRPMPNTFHQSFKYAYKRFRTFYPLELINLILYIFFIKNIKLNQLNLTDIEVIIANILMIKSWSSYKFVFFSFNGVSWFLSSLLFCYFMVPFLLCGIETLKKSIILFNLIAIIRIGIQEFINHKTFNIFNINLHVNPIIRCLEFYLGMLMIPFYFNVKYYFNKIHNNYYFKILFTFIEIILIIILYFLIIRFIKDNYRCYFVLLFCLFIFVIGSDYGYLSDIFSLKFFRIIISYQM